MFEELAKAVPIQGKLGYLSATAAAAGLGLPYVGFIPANMTYILNGMGLPGAAIGTSMGLALTAFTVPFLLAKGKVLFIPDEQSRLRKDRIIKLGTMTFSESDLFTNILITGAIGSGKTSSVIYPILRQVCNLYNNTQEDSADPNQKWGGLVLDVKGEFYETLIYFLHKSGRNVLYDLILIRPDADYPIVKLQDPDTGYYWFICAAGGGEAREIDLLTEGYTLADGNKIPSTIFTGTAEDRAPHEPHLKELVMDVKRSLSFIGWREEGGKMVRVQHTDEPGEIHYMLDANGDKIRVDPPKRLKYVNVEHVNNGIRYNICSPHLPPAEVASRLVSIAETLGGGGGGDNQYWTDSAKKHIGFIIHLWRNLHKEQASALEIVRLTTQKSALDDEIRALEARISELNEEFLSNQDDVLKMKEKDAKRRFLTDVMKYFTDEWGKLDPKTKGIIVSVISNLFGPFITDYQLQEVFCKPATITFEDTIQRGKIVTLLAGGQYETLAKQLGTSLKMDFQSICKSRTTQAHYNKKRVVMFMADEAQVYVTAGGGNNTGDENFMALSRQSRVINCIATQSDSSIISVIGDKKAPVYFQSFGGRVWLQNTDYTTNENAARILGKVKKEKVSNNGREFSVDSVFGKESGASVSTSYEDDQRFKIETFSNLNVFDAIIYNKGKKGSRDKATKYKGKPDAVGDPNSSDHKERFMTLRWFYQAYIENRLHIINESYRLDHVSGNSKPKSPIDEIREAEEEKIAPAAATDNVASNQTAQENPAAEAAPRPKRKKIPGFDIEDLNEPTPATSTPVPPLVNSQTFVATGAPGIAAAAPMEPDDLDDDEDIAIAGHLLGDNPEDKLTAEKLKDLEARYGSSAEVGRKIIAFATLIDDAELPMRTDFDPESLLHLNPFDEDTAQQGMEDGVFTDGKLPDPFPLPIQPESRSATM